MLPRLLPRFGLIGSAVLVGIAWGCWHLPADYIGLKGYGDWFWAAFLIQGPLLLTAHSLIMTWLWQRTDGSLLLMVIYHASITASAILGLSVGEMGQSAVISAALSTAITWIVALLAIWRLRQDNRTPA